MKAAHLTAALILAWLFALTPCQAEESKSQPAPEQARKPAASDVQKPAMEAMSADFMRQVMETSERIESVRKKIKDREKTICETNEQVKALRSQMRQIQKTINDILDADEELAELQMNRDMLWTVMPVLSRTAAPRPMFRAPPRMR